MKYNGGQLIFLLETKKALRGLHFKPIYILAILLPIKFIVSAYHIIYYYYMWYEWQVEFGKSIWFIKGKWFIKND